MLNLQSLHGLEMFDQGALMLPLGTKHDDAGSRDQHMILFPWMHMSGGAGFRRQHDVAFSV